MFDQKTIRALATLREAATHPSIGGMLRQAINELDNAGVFAALDEQTEYASAVDILAGAALKESAEDRFDFEHGAESIGRHRRVPVDEPLYGAEADRVRDALHFQDGPAGA